MHKNYLLCAIALFITLNLLWAKKEEPANEDSTAQKIAKRMEKYVLTPMPFDAAQYTSKEKELLQTLIEAGKLVDEIYWRQTYANNVALRTKL